MEDYPCPHCPRRFPTRHAYGGHLRHHTDHIRSARGSSVQAARAEVSPVLSSASSSRTDYLPPQLVGGSADKGNKRDAAAAGSYSLRDKPKKSCRYLDHEYASSSNWQHFTTAAFGGAGGGGVSAASWTRPAALAVLNGGESDSGSAPAVGSGWRRSREKSWMCSTNESSGEEEDVPHRSSKLKPFIGSSSASAVTYEDDPSAMAGANLLLMLSRDLNADAQPEAAPRDCGIKVANNPDYTAAAKGSSSSSKDPRTGMYICKTCKAPFTTQQALGGHRARFRKSGTCGSLPSTPLHAASRTSSSRPAPAPLGPTSPTATPATAALLRNAALSITILADPVKSLRLVVADPETTAADLPRGAVGRYKVSSSSSSNNASDIHAHNASTSAPDHPPSVSPSQSNQTSAVAVSARRDLFDLNLPAPTDETDDDEVEENKPKLSPSSSSSFPW